MIGSFKPERPSLALNMGETWPCLRVIKNTTLWSIRSHHGHVADVWRRIPAGASDMHRLYSSAIQPLMQTLLATLADVDLAHECELESVAGGSADDMLKALIVSNLQEQHRQRREPYLQQLADLEARIRAVMPDVTHGRQARDAA